MLGVWQLKVRGVDLPKCSEERRCRDSGSTENNLNQSESTATSTSLLSITATLNQKRVTASVTPARFPFTALSEVPWMQSRASSGYSTPRSTLHSGSGGANCAFSSRNLMPYARIWRGKTRNYSTVFRDSSSLSKRMKHCGGSYVRMYRPLLPVILQHEIPTIISSSRTAVRGKPRLTNYNMLSDT